MGRLKGGGDTNKTSVLYPRMPSFPAGTHLHPGATFGNFRGI